MVEEKPDWSFRKVFLSKQIKYEVLDEIFGNAFKSEVKDNTVNIFLDASSIFNNIFSAQMTGYFDYGLSKAEKYTYSIAMLNYVGHYRNYIWNRHNKYTTFYIYYPSTVSSYHMKALPSFKNDIYARRFYNIELTEQREYYYNNLALLKEYVQLIPHVYLVDSGDIDDIVVPYFMIRRLKLDDNHNIIMSNRVTALSIEGHFDHTHVMSVKAGNSLYSDNDKSLQQMLVTGNIKTAPKSLTEKEYPFVRNYIIPILSIIGYKNFDIPRLPKMGVLTTLNKIAKAIQNNHLLNTKMELVPMLKKMGEVGIFKEEDVVLIMTNVKLLVLDMIYAMYPNIMVDKLLDQMTDIQDLDLLVDTNNEHLGGNVKLKMLMAGEK